jgi:hypothetical protein
MRVAFVGLLLLVGIMAAPVDVVTLVRDANHDNILGLVEQVANVAWRDWFQTQGITSASILANGFVSVQDFETIWTMNNAPGEANTGFIIKSRLRALFKCIVTLEKSKVSQLEQTFEQDALGGEIDAPLSTDDRQRLVTVAQTKYGVTFPPNETPAPSLIGRLVRESKSLTASYIPIHKVRSLLGQQMSDKGSKVKIGTFNISTSTEVESSVSIDSNLTFLNQLTILTNAWTLAGAKTLENGKQWCPIQMSTDYLRRFREAASVFSTSELVQIDTQIRSAMVDLVNNGDSGDTFTLGEAIKRAVADHRFMLIPRLESQLGTSASSSSNPHPPGFDYSAFNVHHDRRSRKGDKGKGGRGGRGGKHGKGNDRGKGGGAKHPGPKKHAKTNKWKTGWYTSDGTEICKFHQDNRGPCRNNQCKKGHVCDVVVDSKGTICGKAHRRVEHT